MKTWHCSEKGIYDGPRLVQQRPNRNPLLVNARNRVIVARDMGDAR